MGVRRERVALRCLWETATRNYMRSLQHKTPEGAKKERLAVPIIAKENESNFKPAPAGPAVAVGCDVVDLGMLKASFPGKPDTMKHKIKVVWMLGEMDPETGKRFTVQQRYTLSLHEKAALRKDLESWRGRAFTADERQGFDVEKIIGVPCFLNIVHNEKNGSTYANVQSIMPLPKGMPKVAVDPAYIREKDRPKDQPAGNGQSPAEDPDHFQATDDDVPF